MSDMLELLRSKNPTIPFYSVLDDAFAPYGRVLTISEADTAALTAAMAAAPIPEAGTVYVAHDPKLLPANTAANLKRVVFGGMPMQHGYCNGRDYTLNALEYHKCSEINFSTTGCVLLLALPSDLKDGCLDSADVVGFYLPANVCIEVLPLVLHYAPCRIADTGFNCMVCLEEGVNSPLDSVNTAAPGEEKMLWMCNKWLIAHPESGEAAQGAFVGIHGINLTVAM